MKTKIMVCLGDLLIYLRIWERKDPRPQESEVECIQIGTSPTAEATIWGHTRGVLALLDSYGAKEEENRLREEIKRLKEITINNLKSFKDEGAEVKTVCNETMGEWAAWIRPDVFKLLYIYVKREIQSLQGNGALPRLSLEFQRQDRNIKIVATKLD